MHRLRHLSRCHPRRCHLPPPRSLQRDPRALTSAGGPPARGFHSPPGATTMTPTMGPQPRRCASGCGMGLPAGSGGATPSLI